MKIGQVWPVAITTKGNELVQYSFMKYLAGHVPKGIIVKISTVEYILYIIIYILCVHVETFLENYNYKGHCAR